MTDTERLRLALEMRGTTRIVVSERDLPGIAARLSTLDAQRDGHYVEKCRECGAIVSQCRCPARDKVERLVTCEKCKTKETTSETVTVARDFMRKAGGEWEMWRELETILRGREQANEKEIAALRELVCGVTPDDYLPIDEELADVLRRARLARRSSEEKRA